MSKNNSPIQSASPGPIRPFPINGTGEIRISSLIQRPLEEEEEQLSKVTAMQDENTDPLADKALKSTAESSLNAEKYPKQTNVPGKSTKLSGKEVPAKIKPKTTGNRMPTVAEKVPVGKPQGKLGTPFKMSPRVSTPKPSPATRVASPKKAPTSPTKLTLHKPPSSPTKLAFSKPATTPKNPRLSRIPPIVTTGLEIKREPGTESPPPAPATPIAKGRKFHSCSHDHSPPKKGYTPKMRDPRPPTVDWKDIKLSPKKHEQDWTVDMKNLHDQEVSEEIVIQEEVQLEEPALLQSGDEEPSTTVPPFPISEVDMIELKHTLHKIAIGDIFCITLGDMVHLPDLADMPIICQHILDEFDFTDPNNFIFFQENGYGSLLCKVVTKYLASASAEDLQEISGVKKLSVVNRINDDPHQFVEYFQDEIEIQRANIAELQHRLKGAEDERNRYRRDLQCANQQLQKLISLHATAYSLHLDRVSTSAVVKTAASDENPD